MKTIFFLLTCLFAMPLASHGALKKDNNTLNISINNHILEIVRVGEIYKSKSNFIVYSLNENCLDSTINNNKMLKSIQDIENENYQVDKYVERFSKSNRSKLFKDLFTKSLNKDALQYMDSLKQAVILKLTIDKNGKILNAELFLRGDINLFVQLKSIYNALVNISKIKLEPLNDDCKGVEIFSFFMPLK